MILEESLYAFVTSDTAVAALIDLRMYGGMQPQKGAQPCIVYSRLSPTKRTQTLCATDSKVCATLLIECYDKSYLGSKHLAAAVRHTIIDFQGDMAGTRVSSIALDDESDVVLPEPGLFGVSQTYSIWFTEE